MHSFQVLNDPSAYPEQYWTTISSQGSTPLFPDIQLALEPSRLHQTKSLNSRKIHKLFFYQVLFKILLFTSKYIFSFCNTFVEFQIASRSPNF